MFPSLSLSLCSPPLLRSNTAASLLPPLIIPPHLSPIFAFLSSTLCPIPSVPKKRRACRSWPSRGTSWGPTRPSSPRNTRTPARTQPEPRTPPSVGMTWRARAEEEERGARPTATGPLTAPAATSVRTTEIFLGGECGWSCLYFLI